MKKQTQLSEIEKTVFYAIEKAIKAYRQYAQKNIKARGLDITIDQWLILKTIHDHPELSQREIAEMIFKDHASVTRMIELLVKRSYISRSFNETDRRRFVLKLTEEGRDMYKMLIPIVSSNRMMALEGLSLAEIENLHKSLSRIIDNCIP